MNIFDSDLVRKLRYVENQFIQVLVDRFRLTRRGTGVELAIRFSDDSPTISTRRAKTRVQEMVSDFEKKAAEYQSELEAFFLGNAPSYEYRDADFPFRFASGGTLPIIRSDNRDYYCLFYRDIHPIGWNIANGGCASREELLDPMRTVYRELCEELIIVDRYLKERYTFGYPEAHPFEREGGQEGSRVPFAATDLWHMPPTLSWLQVFPELASGQFRLLPAPMKWLSGPDSVYITIEGVDAGQVQGCYLNINGQDFGIEVDKIARINLSSPRAVICDGEHTGNCVMNRLIGLFDTERMDEEVARGDSRFVPDRVFFNAEQDEGATIDSIIEDRVVPYLRHFRSDEETKEFASCTEKLDLCPVTRSLLRRIRTTSLSSGRNFPVPIRPSAPVDVFISYGGEDEKIARVIHSYLESSCSVFFFPSYPFNDTANAAIDEALESARYMIVVCTRPENLLRDHCEYEWRKFLSDVKQGFKQGAVIVPFIEEGIRESNLPQELQEYAAEKFRELTIRDDLSHLAAYRIPDVLRRAANA